MTAATQQPAQHYPRTLSLEKIIELLREDKVLGTIKILCRYAYGLARLFYLRKIKKATEATCRIHGYRMITLPQGAGIASELILLGNHEKIASRELQNRLRAGWHVVDLGANIGYYALMEALGIGPTGKVHAIEPAPENYELLVRNVELNGFGDIISTHRLAIGDRRGMVPMTLSHAMNRHTFLSIETESIKKTLDVPMMTFGDFVDEHGVDLEKLALVRMDIEGFEAKVLPGIAEVLRGRCGVNLQIEFHPTQIDEHPECSFSETLQVLQTLTDRFEWLLARRGHRKIMLRNISIDDVLASETLMSQNNFESWLTVRRS